MNRLTIIILGFVYLSGCVAFGMANAKEVADTEPMRALIQKDHTNEGFHLVCGDPYQLEAHPTKFLIQCFRVKSPTRAEDNPMVCAAGGPPKYIDCGTVF